MGLAMPGKSETIVVLALLAFVLAVMLMGWADAMRLETRAASLRCPENYRLIQHSRKFFCAQELPQ